VLGGFVLARILLTRPADERRAWLAESTRRQHITRGRASRAAAWRDTIMDELNRRGFDSDSHMGSGVMLFMAGALVGAAAALIFAPATGADARAFIGRRGRELADDVATRGKQFWNEHGDRVASAVKRGYEQATGTTRESVNGATDSGQAM
jgi:gas vesicle protein